MGGVGGLPSTWQQLAIGGLAAAINVGTDIARSKYVPQQVNEVYTVDARGRVQNAGTPTQAQSVGDAFSGFIANPTVSLTTFLLVVVVVALIARGK